LAQVCFAQAIVGGDLLGRIPDCLLCRGSFAPMAPPAVPPLLVLDEKLVDEASSSSIDSKRERGQRSPRSARRSQSAKIVRRPDHFDMATDIDCLGATTAAGSDTDMHTDFTASSSPCKPSSHTLSQGSVGWSPRSSPSPSHRLHRESLPVCKRSIARDSAVAAATAAVAARDARKFASRTQAVSAAIDERFEAVERQLATKASTDTVLMMQMQVLDLTTKNERLTAEVSQLRGKLGTSALVDYFEWRASCTSLSLSPSALEAPGVALPEFSDERLPCVVDQAVQTSVERRFAAIAEDLEHTDTIAESDARAIMPPVADWRSLAVGEREMQTNVERSFDLSDDEVLEVLTERVAARVSAKLCLKLPGPRSHSRSGGNAARHSSPAAHFRKSFYPQQVLLW